MKNTNLLVFCALTIASSNSYADDLLDRLETATELLGAKHGEFYLSKLPELEGKMPDWNWDDEIRTASACVLTGIKKAKGAKVAEAYVSGIELDAKRDIASMSQMRDQTNMPEELQGEDTTLLNLMQECGTIEISATRLQDSGLWDELIKPGTMEKLAAD
jgi:hypothetical protein